MVAGYLLSPRATAVARTVDDGTSTKIGSTFEVVPMSPERAHVRMVIRRRRWVISGDDSSIVAGTVTVSRALMHSVASGEITGAAAET